MPKLIKTKHLPSQADTKNPYSCEYQRIDYIFELEKQSGDPLLHTTTLHVGVSDVEQVRSVGLSERRFRDVLSKMRVNLLSCLSSRTVHVYRGLRQSEDSKKQGRGDEDTDENEVPSPALAL